MWRLGMTRMCVGACGWMSAKASTSSVSWRRFAGMVPATILQKRQSGEEVSGMGLWYSPGKRLRSGQRWGSSCGSFVDLEGSDCVAKGGERGCALVLNRGELTVRAGEGIFLSVEFGGVATDKVLFFR